MNKQHEPRRDPLAATPESPRARRDNPMACLTPARLARLGLLLSLAGLLTLHLVPAPVLTATTGQVVAYDPRVKFLSEYVRTQYGPLDDRRVVLACRLGGGGLLGVAAGGAGPRGQACGGCGDVLGASGVVSHGPGGPSAGRLTCGDPLRIEPCTWAGRVHAPLSSVVFGCIAGTWGSVAWRRRPAMAARGVGGARVHAVGRVPAGWLRALPQQAPGTGRHWIGLMQRSLVAPALMWL